MSNADAMSMHIEIRPVCKFIPYIRSYVNHASMKSVGFHRNDYVENHGDEEFQDVSSILVCDHNSF